MKKLYEEVLRVENKVVSISENHNPFVLGKVYLRVTVSLSQFSIVTIGLDSHQ